MNDLRRRGFHRVLIIKPSSLGDVIHALPVLHGLRTRWPRAGISWLVAESCAGLLEGHPELDEVIRFDRRRYGLIGRNLRVTVEFGEFVQGLRVRAFDLVIDLQGLFRSAFLAFAAGAPERLGFADAREFASMFYTRRVAVRGRDLHAVDRNYAFAQLLGFEDVPIRFEIPVAPAADARVAGWLAEGGIGPGQPFALLGPATRWETKQWPAGCFAEVARGISRRYGWPVVLAGTPSEAPVAREVASRAGAVVNLAGRTSVQELVALVARAGLVVMNDSGPMHIAAAMGKPLVALYGPTNPLRTGPYRRPEAVLRHDLPCSPCYFKRLAQCPHEHVCLRGLEPREVLARVDQCLAARAETA